MPEENLAQRVARLQRELETAQRQIAACAHQFMAPRPATREATDWVYKGLESHGSDPYPIYEPVPKTEYGWERSCAVCGYLEYTTKTKPIITGMGPDFGNRR